MSRISLKKTNGGHAREGPMCQLACRDQVSDCGVALQMVVRERIIAETNYSASGNIICAASNVGRVMRADMWWSEHV